MRAVIKQSGPMFSANVSEIVKKATRAGLFDVAVEATSDVQDQLYKGHGWKTGRLKGSIAARQFSDLGYEIESGALTGMPVVYAYWIETGKRNKVQTKFQGYKMFENTWRKMNANRTRINKIMIKTIVRALS